MAEQDDTGQNSFDFTETLETREVCPSCGHQWNAVDEEQGAIAAALARCPQCGYEWDDSVVPAPEQADDGRQEQEKIAAGGEDENLTAETDTEQQVTDAIPVADAVETGQLRLIDMKPDWEVEWQGMPEFEQRHLEAPHALIVNFRNREDRNALAKLMEQTLTPQTRSVWYPKATIQSEKAKRYASPQLVQPRYPFYIVSKGRWESRLTSKALDALGIQYHIVVEPQEYDAYAAVIKPANILTLPFGNLGQGSIPARNWVWEHAIATGTERHWILDDNITGFHRLHRNFKRPAVTGSIFLAAEDFTDRHTNVAESGFNYYMFAPRKEGGIRPYTLNTRIYSCILLRNDLPYRWRGRYNEDTDLSLRILKDGHCTILFNAFLAHKITTMQMKGGNTDELYQDDGRMKMAQSLYEQHPDIVKITWKWGRWQHQVDYRQFRKNKLILKPDVIVPQEANNYGMELEHADDTLRFDRYGKPKACED